MRFWVIATVFCALAGAACAPPALAQAPIAAEQITRGEVEGRNTIRLIPPNPRGIIFLFHGSGGSEAFATNPTTQRTLQRFVAAGYGYISSASLQRDEPRRWNLSSADPADNPDLAYMLRLHKRLVDGGEILANTPVFTMGMSNGGGMANLFGIVAKKEGLPVAAVADYMGPFPASMSSVVSRGIAPAATFVVAAERDGLVSATNILEAASRIGSAGSMIETHLVKETVLRPDAFTNIGGVDEAASASIFADLVEQGIISGDGKRTIYADAPVITREHQVALLDRLSAADNGPAILRVILTAWAAHIMRSDLADEQFAFFEAALDR